MAFFMVMLLIGSLFSKFSVSEACCKKNNEMTSIEVAKCMGNGINLGNTMEAYGHKYLGTKASVTSYETLWGQPVTTKAMIHGMKVAGFDSLRIPVAWTNTMDFETGDYTISKQYLDRVEEIIQYAYEDDMYVIINDHWDGSWWGMFGSANQETREKAMKLYVSMWSQIAKRYRKYDDHLIFEAANEELGDRLNDVDLCPDGNTLTKDECFATAAKITQAFVDTIRKSDGNNRKRFLLIPGYNTDFENTLDARFHMPTDTVQNKLLVSVHYYNPWGYCGNSSVNHWGSVKEYEEQNRLLASMQQFTNAGYGVVIGEYAVAFNEDGSVKNNICDYINNFLNNCDLYGYCPMLWDCNGLYSKQNAAMIDSSVAQLYANRSYEKQASQTEEEIRTNAQNAMNEALEVAKSKDPQKDFDDQAAMAWMMYSSSDWSVMYSVGDKYDPTAKTDGMTTTDAKINGAGTYTIGLDFTGTGNGYATGTAFSAIGIANGEKLYPGYAIKIQEIKINGQFYTYSGKEYTTSDDGICTRVNLYNEWLSYVPAGARTIDGDLTNATAMILDNNKLGNVETIEITFYYGPQQ